MKPHKDSPVRRGPKALWIGTGLFVLALVVRVVYLIGISSHPAFDLPIVDSGSYHEIARSLAEGNKIGPDLFWQVFLYPLFLSGIYKLFGISILAAKVVQIIIGSLVCVLVFFLGRKIFDGRTGILAGCLTAVYGPLLYFEGELLATGLAAFWSVVLILVYLEALEKKTLLLCFAAGLLSALSVLTRVTFLPFVAAFGIWIVFRLWRSAMQRTAVIQRVLLLLGGFLLVTGPVAFKCQSTTGRFSFLPGTGALNLYMGNNPDRPEIMALRPGSDWDRLLNEPILHGAKTLPQARAYFMDRFWGYLFSRPFHFMNRMARKTAHLFSSREIPSNMDLYAARDYSFVLSALMWKAGGFGFPFGVLLPLALLGIVIHRRRIPMPIILYLTIYPLAIILVFVTARYRAPMIPILGLFAAAGIWSLMDRIKKRNLFQAGGLLVGAGVFSLVISLPGPFAAEEVDYEAELQYCLGNQCRSIGRLKEAETHLRRAIELDPQSSDAHGILGLCLSEQGQTQEALARFNKAIELDPDLESAHFNLGTFLSSLKRPDEALIHFQEALRINPLSRQARECGVSIRVNQGSLLGREGKAKEAAKRFREALAMDPQSGFARYSLAISLSQMGKFEEALRELDLAMASANKAKDRTLATKINSLAAQITAKIQNRSR